MCWSKIASKRAEFASVRTYGTASAPVGKGYSLPEVAIHPGVFQWLKH